MKVNPVKLAIFAEAYRAGLAAAVAEAPDAYAYGAADAPKVALKMMRTIAAQPMGVNYDGGGFRRAARALGIKHTRKAILEFLEYAPGGIPAFVDCPNCSGVTLEVKTGRCASDRCAGRPLVFDPGTRS